eukprot:COSAG01_NODE_3434_length_6100_cov_7.180970_5_plen_103_part_00
MAQVEGVTLARELGGVDVQRAPEPVPPELSCCARLCGGEKYQIELNEWHETDDSHSDLRLTRSLRQKRITQRRVLNASECRWDYRELEFGAAVFHPPPTQTR